MRSRLIFSFAVLAMFAGCDRSSPKGDAAPPHKPNGAKEADQHSDHDGHDHGSDQHKDADKSDGQPGHGGEMIELGTSKAGELTIRAARSKGDVKPGAEAHIEAWVLASDSKPATVATVRVWIGTEDAKGSIKAKAEIDNPNESNHWHTHAEVPDPMMPDAMLWVEVESAPGQKATGSFGLKP